MLFFSFGRIICRIGLFCLVIVLLPKRPVITYCEISGKVESNEKFGGRFFTLIELSRTKTK
jgi:hypothetical protein